jgi:hypothetical protein
MSLDSTSCFQVHKSITTLQGEDIVFLATDINLPGERARYAVVELVVLKPYLSIPLPPHATPLVLIGLPLQTKPKSKRSFKQYCSCSPRWTAPSNFRIIRILAQEKQQGIC